MNPFPLVLESVRDLDREQLTYLFQLAKGYKERSISPPKVISLNKQSISISTNFLENSTRTKYSFVAAIKSLGAEHLNFESSTSSQGKGESLEDTFLTLKAQGVKLAIVRTPISGELKRFKKDPPLALINGGDGMHQHPTQALIDVFTMQELGLKIAGSTMCIIGDCLHSRVCHSLLDLLGPMKMKLILCGPKGCVPTYQLPDNISVSHCVDETILKSDWVYQLRVQSERHKSFGSSNYFTDFYKNFGLTKHRLKKLSKAPLIFNPGPAKIGMEISQELIRSDLYMGNLQVEHSIPMRMAIIHAMIERLAKENKL